jgi:hypothetical protein
MGMPTLPDLARPGEALEALRAVSAMGGWPPRDAADEWRVYHHTIVLSADPNGQLLEPRRMPILRPSWHWLSETGGAPRCLLTR